MKAKSERQVPEAKTARLVTKTSESVFTNCWSNSYTLSPGPGQRTQSPACHSQIQHVIINFYKPPTPAPQPVIRSFAPARHGSAITNTFLAKT